MNPEQDRPAATLVHSTAAANAPLISTATKEQWTSEELLGDRVEIQIRHGHEVYRLRRTKQGKLILHK